MKVEDYSARTSGDRSSSVNLRTRGRPGVSRRPAFREQVRKEAYDIDEAESGPSNSALTDYECCTRRHPMWFRRLRLITLAALLLFTLSLPLWILLAVKILSDTF